jgi:uncharacterized membrane protein
MQDVFKEWTLIIALVVEGGAVLVIALGALQTLWRGLGVFFLKDKNANRRIQETTKDEVRLAFGRWLAMGLEFELAADILRTAVAPSWDEIGKLAAIAVLRTALNYFLQREIQQISKDSADTAKLPG